jgi:SprB repeat
MKLFKLFLLCLLGAFTVSNVAGQANASINVLTLNSGNVNQGGTVNIQVTVGNTGPVSNIGVYRVRTQISVPAALVNILPNAQQTGLPAGWTITSNNGSVINLSNGTDIIPVGVQRTILIAVQGNNLGGPSTVSGQLNFSNGNAPGTAPGSLAGDNTADNTSQSSITVVPAAACNLTGATLAAPAIACNGGTTTLTVTPVTTGATATLEYSVAGINGGAFQAGNTFTVPAGSYTATVREAGNPSCTATSSSFTVSEPAAIGGSAAAGAIACAGGTTTLTVTATGGTGALQYSLNGGPFQAGNTFNVNAAGSPYVVTVRDANNCTVALPQVSVSQPSAVVPTAAVTTPIAVFGGTGTITVSATGGTGAKTFVVTSGPTVNTTGATTGVFTGLLAGTYTFTATDANGCSVVTAPLQLTQPAAVCNLAVSIAATPIACNGGTTTLTATATGANGAVEYSLNGGAFQSANTFTVNAAGSPYTVVAREVAIPTCTATSTALTVTQPTAVAASAAVTTPIAVFGGTGTITVTATGGTGAKTYVIVSGTTINTTGATTGVFTGLASGSYTFRATDVNGCNVVTTAVSLVQPGLLVADPAVGQMSFTTLANAPQNANTLLFTQAYRLNIPFYNLNQTDEVPNGTIQLRINLGSKLILDPAFNLATAPLNNFFTWTSQVVADSVIITGTQTAAIPADFDGTLSFNVRGELSCTATLSSRINIVNILATLGDEDLQNNSATLQYTLPVTVTTTQVNVTCNGANNGIINVTTSPGATFVIRNAANAVVGNTNLAPGVYTITATATGDAPAANVCTNSTTVTIVQPAVLTTSISGTTNNVCNGGNQGTLTAVSAGGTAPYTYTITGPTVNTTGANSGVFTGLLAGTYTVTSTDANGCTATTTATITQPTGTAPDISLGSDITGSLFATTGTSQTIVYNVTEIAGNPSVGDTIRITRVSGFTISFNPAVFSTTVGGTTYVLDNSRWKIDNSNPSFVSIILTDPNNASAPGTLLCNQRVNVSVTLTRNTPNISTFTLSARLRRSNGEVNLANNLNSIILTAE